MSKQNVIKNFIDAHPNEVYSTSELCTHAACTLPTVLKFIKDNPERFEKISRGKYQIISANTLTMTTAETTEVTYTTTNAEQLQLVAENPPAFSIPKPTFDW